jgi:diguanylate cyclase (GGDEF)-like protein
MNQDRNLGVESADDWMVLLRHVLDRPPEFAVLAKGADVVHVSAGLARVLGYKDFDDLRSSGDFKRHISGLDDSPVEGGRCIRALISAVEHSHILTLEARGARSKMRFETRVTPLPAPESHLIALSKFDVLEESPSYIDPLTGTFSRASIMDKLREEVAHRNYERDAVGASLIFLSVDRFRTINDEYGGAAGDQLLKEVSRLIQDNIRISDRLGRWEDNRFAILAGAGSDLNRAKRVAERLRRKIEGNNFSQVSSVVTSSLAVSEIQPKDSADALLARLEASLDAAVEQGGNRVVLA